MGFRDLESFNLAILARQGWRILKQPNSLLAKLLKAKYFSSTSFLKANAGHNPSYTWRSLMAAQHVVEEGTVWSIGSGNNVNVWSDRWIPRPLSYKVIGNVYGGDPDLSVIDLIEWNVRRWRTDLLHDLFLPVDAEIISQIRLIDPSICDEQIWTHCKGARSPLEVLITNNLTKPSLPRGALGRRVETTRRKYGSSCGNRKFPPKSKASSGG